jgi:hypothetical protein
MNNKMQYKLYTDRNENFECEVSVKNASVKNSIARLIVESSDGPNLVFKGQLNGEKCVIPIKRLKGILDENTHGKMHLEVIVEDTYFRPWESDFIVEEHTSVKVKINENKSFLSNKPTVRIKSPILKYVGRKQSQVIKPTKKRGINIFVPKKEIVTICEQFGIRRKNFQRNQKEFVQILKEYFRANPEYNYHAREILSGIGDFLR